MANDLVAAWGIAIFAARESVETLEKTIIAAIDAASERAVIDVLVNGNRALADEAALLECVRDSSTRNPLAAVRVWFIPLGDKAHAWNQYVHIIWPRSKLSFFVDGYVRINRDSLKLLDLAVSSSPEHLAGTGVPSVGHSASSLRDEMIKNGGMHGNLFVLKASTMEALREIDFKLPIGLYRTDSTIGAALSFNLDPSRHPWNPKGRILVHPDATWVTDEKSPWVLSDVVGQLKRILRQGQGILENLAVRNHFATQKKSPKDLPHTAADLVLKWRRAFPKEALVAFCRHPILVGLALRKLSEPRSWKYADTPPELKSVPADWPRAGDT